MNTPTMTPGTVEMVSVEWIMQNATGSVDGFGVGDGSVDYSDMAWDKSGDSWFPALVAAIMTQGFRVPIVLVMNKSRFGDVVHGNGHHRMIAAILLCLDEIPVYWSDWETERDYMCEHASEGGELWDIDTTIVDGLGVDNLKWVNW